jgi:uncharacterized DUF497 family protein
MRCEWDENKNRLNREKHGVSFEEAAEAFADGRRLIAPDAAHSDRERRFLCYGMAGGTVLTVRFTLRDGVIRIIGAGKWRKGRKLYEKNRQNQD